MEDLIQKKETQHAEKFFTHILHLMMYIEGNICCNEMWTFHVSLTSAI